ncbi:MAG: zinc ribbon domain-containing protein [Anaerolineales bacterium]|nr:zinc ribbon domain-containing protein [Anaerolineales bacterium]
MVFDPSSLNNFLLIAAAWGGAFIASFWLSLLVWTYRDIRSRVKDPLVRILAVLVVAVLFLPGIVVYLILRPPQTMEEEYQHMLEEEALLQAIEERSACPGCGRHTAEDWIVCPNCHTKLMKNCHACDRLLKLSWSLCPYCATPEPGKRREDISIKEAIQSVEINELEEVDDVIEEDEVNDVVELDEVDDLDHSGDGEELDDLSDEDLINAL